MMFWYAKVEEAVALAAGMGFDAIEVWAEHLWRSEEDPRRVRQALNAQGLVCTVHCPIMDINITSPNRGIRAESLRQMLQAIELSHDLEAQLLVAHPGQLFSKHDAIGEYWDVQLAAFELMVDHAQKLGVRLAVENMDYQSSAEVVKGYADLQRINARFPGVELGIVLDTTHLGSTERNLDFILQCPSIGHTHLSDARADATGKVQLHLPIGEGDLDFARILAALLPRNQGILSLETFVPPGNPDKILSQRCRLEALVLSSQSSLDARAGQRSPQ